MEKGILQDSPVVPAVGRGERGPVEDRPMLDLCYVEDSAAQVDMNAVMIGGPDDLSRRSPGTGEGRTFTRPELSALLDLADKESWI